MLLRLVLFAVVGVVITFAVYSVLKPSKALPIYHPADLKPELTDHQSRKTKGEHHILDFRLVDQLGGLDEAIELVRKRANIGATDRIKLVPFPPKRTLFDQIFNANESVLAQLRPATPEVLARRTARAWARGLGLDGLDPELWAKGGIFCLPMFSLRIQ